MQEQQFENFGACREVKFHRARYRDRGQGYRMFKSISTRKLSSQAARLSLPRNEVFVSG